MSSKNTIQQRIDNSDEVMVYCHNSAHCHHKARLDLVALRARLGPDHGAMHDDLVPKLRCTKCQSKKVGIIISPRDANHRVEGGRNLYAKTKGE